MREGARGAAVWRRAAHGGPMFQVQAVRALQVRLPGRAERGQARRHPRGTGSERARLGRVCGAGGEEAEGRIHGDGGPGEHEGGAQADDAGGAGHAGARERH